VAKLASCHETASLDILKGKDRSKYLTIALAGNANVGKSVIFNRLTGSSQTIGNWPGKTVERATPSLPSPWKRLYHESTLLRRNQT
jgi:ferrous iron transport protein B